MCNANFSNWYLELKNEGGCLVLLYTLQNKAEPEVCRTVKKFLKSNNYVRNRDRQDPRAVLKIFNEENRTYHKYWIYNFQLSQNLPKYCKDMCWIP